SAAFLSHHIEVRTVLVQRLAKSLGRGKHGASGVDDAEHVIEHLLKDIAQTLDTIGGTLGTLLDVIERRHTKFAAQQHLGVHSVKTGVKVNELLTDSPSRLRRPESLLHTGARSLGEWVSPLSRERHLLARESVSELGSVVLSGLRALGLPATGQIGRAH